MSRQPSSKQALYTALGLYGGLGIQLVASVGAGAWLGQWLDEKFLTQPWLMVLGLFLGAIVGFYNLIRIVTRKNS